MSIRFHNLSDHVEFSFAQVMAALFIALFILKISFDLFEDCLVERILPLLFDVECSLQVETGHLEYWFDVVFHYLDSVALLECWLLSIDLLLAKPLRNASFGNSVKYCLLLVVLFLLLLREILLFLIIVYIIDGLFYFVSLLYLHFLFNHLSILPFLWMIAALSFFIPLFKFNTWNSILVFIDYLILALFLLIFVKQIS